MAENTVVLAWIGATDLRAAEGTLEHGVGPIASARKLRSFDRVVLLSNYPEDRTQNYLIWYRTQFEPPPELQPIVLNSPINFPEIYQAVVAVVDAILKDQPEVRLVFHLSPGTPAMAAVWLILGNTRYQAELIQTRFDFETKTNELLIVDFPFELSAEYVGDVLRGPDQELIRSSQGLPPVAPEFESIIHQCHAMKRVLTRAQQVAIRSVPVLIQGESGTGKELLARAIHEKSPRSRKRFVAINCGAIPAELVESEFFGHKKGAFTGATEDRKGAFQAADGGTLFLDEVGELPLKQQVKLLRALQEQKVRPVGDNEETSVDVRVICATHQNLYENVFTGSFREDLFHRIAVAILELPPLREREGDLGMIIDALLEELNEQHELETKGEPRTLSPDAKQVLLNHSWPGNVRELKNTLLRALIWSHDDVITAEDAEEALLRRPREHLGLLDHELGLDLDVGALELELRRHYVERALKRAGTNRSEAGRLLGDTSPQTLNNWLKKLGIVEDKV